MACADLIPAPVNKVKGRGTAVKAWPGGLSGA
jgi:hypothetical protein